MIVGCASGAMIWHSLHGGRHAAGAPLVAFLVALLAAATSIPLLPPDARFFLWAQLFEPHDPYESHADFAFGDMEVDRYDAEIAVVDRAIGNLARAVRAMRPHAIVIITADHGEAFGEHRSRFHGTTLYEEQVHVPLLVSAPGLIDPHTVPVAVQTIDLMPTFVSALGYPLPPRVRGNDLCPLLAHPDFVPSPGAAFASLAGATMLAWGAERFVCTKAVAACALYDLRADPHELQTITDPARIQDAIGFMRAAIEGNVRAELYGEPQ